MLMTQIDASREEARKEQSNKTEKPREVVHDETPALITGHKFSPTDQWWSLCRVCRLGEAAHAESELRYVGDDITDD